MKVEASAGIFKLVTYTDGYPHWVEVYIDGIAALHPNSCARFNSVDLEDLEYCARRLRVKLANTA